MPLYRADVWLTDTRPPKPSDFDPDMQDEPEDGFRNQSGLRKVRKSKCPQVQASDILEATREAVDRIGQVAKADEIDAIEKVRVVPVEPESESPDEDEGLLG